MKMITVVLPTLLLVGGNAFTSNPSARGFPVSACSKQILSEHQLWTSLQSSSFTSASSSSLSFVSPTAITGTIPCDSQTAVLAEKDDECLPMSSTSKAVSGVHQQSKDQQHLLISYNRKLKSLSQSRNAGRRAEDILRQMQKQHGLPPHQLSYTFAIVAWSKTYNGAKRAQSLLEEMKTLYQKGKNYSMQPSKVPYTAVISAWANSRDRTMAATRAMELLDEMKQLDCDFSRPNTFTYSACIAAVGGPKALTLLEEVKQRYQNGDVNCRPDAHLYSAVLTAIAKQNASYERAQQVLFELERDYDDCHDDKLKPNPFIYSAAISACLDRSQPVRSIRRAESILQHMQGRYEAGLSDVQPNTVVYNSLLDVCSQSLDADKALTILRSMSHPDSVSYCTVISAFGRSGHPNCGTMAVQLLREAPQQQPNVFIYGAAIAAQAKAGDADTAQMLFDEFESSGGRPNTIMYNSLISAWARQDPARACELLQDMHRRSSSSTNSSPDQKMDCKPNTITYNTVLGALVGAPLLAQALLEDMKRRTAAGEWGVRPNSVTYSTLIGIWAEYPGSSQQVEALLLEMGG